MAGKPGKGGVKGRSGAPGRTKPAGPGRQPTKATLEQGTIVMLSQVWPNGEHADLGRGLVGQVKRINDSSDRVVTIPQEDGSEIRIVIGINTRD